MKQSQLYILIANICFVGSLLTHHIWDSFLLFGLTGFWYFAGIWSMIMERKIERIKRTLERARFEIIVSLLEKRKIKCQKTQ